MTTTDINLVYLDDYHAGDVLFVQSLARSLARMEGRRVVLVHGSGEHAERALEAQGVFRKREMGVLPVETAEEHAVVERALRHVNRKITGALTDAVVPAVGVIGSERGLFRIRSGRLHAENVGWVETLIEQGVVPVAAAFAVDVISRRTGEVPLRLAVEAIFRELHAAAQAVVFTKTNLPGIMKGSNTEPSVFVHLLDDRLVSDIEAVEYFASKHIPVLLTNTTGLSDRSGPIGSRIQISA